jgi:hypothetical protein
MDDDNTRQVVRSDETIVAAEPASTTVSQTNTSTGVAADAAVAGPAATVQTTQATTTPGDRAVSHSYAERVVDPAAEKAAAVGWVNKLIWFIVGVMAILLVIRFVLLLTGADPNVGFSQLMYGLTNWMVEPFRGLFGAPLTFEGSAVAGRFAPEVLVAIVVYLLIGFLVTKLAELLLGTNRTTGTVVSETERQTRV